MSFTHFSELGGEGTRLWIEPLLCNSCCNKLVTCDGVTVSGFYVCACSIFYDTRGETETRLAQSVLRPVKAVQETVGFVFVKSFPNDDRLVGNLDVDGFVTRRSKV